MRKEKRGTRVLSLKFNEEIANSKRSQVTIFIILAVIIVSGVVLFLILRGRIGIGGLPAKFQPIETYFLSCIEEKVETGKEILSKTGGYIYLPEFQPGSEYSPFSNQLDFLGTAVPYWYYVSGNNIIREQVPSNKEMQEQLAKFVKENLDCDFSEFGMQGYDIQLDVKDVSALINRNSIDVEVNADLNMILENETARQTSHKTSINSNLGKFYSEALKIYDYEKQKAFLEDYAVDVLRLYAPVDGVEISCAPKVWLKNEVDEELKQALEANMQAIKLKGNYYTLNSKEDKYFVQDLQVEDNINFLYSRKWPTRIETWEANNGVMMAEPVGNQEGLGILGFCYVPYHFVYDIKYPVLIQVYNNEELFQFPVAVIIEKNKQRRALPVNSFIGESEPEMCKYAVQEMSVYTYNTNLDAVEAKISFNCLGQTCNIGKTKKENNEAVLDANFPQCGNGYIVAEAEGYSMKRYLVSTNKAGTANIVLDKLYNLSVDFRIDSKTSSNHAIIVFSSEENTQTIAWPEQKQVSLSEGYYNVSVYSYRNGSITIPGVKKNFCSEVPKPGLLGIFGMKEEKCYDVDVPSQQLENLISGGGKSTLYFTEDMLQKGKMTIDVNSIPVPDSLEKLQDSYNLLEAGRVNVDFET